MAIAIGEVVTFLPKVIFGVGGGFAAATLHRGAAPALDNVGVYAPVRNFIANTVIGEGVNQVSASELMPAIENLGNVGWKEGLDNVLTALTRKEMGGRGLLLLGGMGAVGALAVGLGTRLFFNSWHTISEIRKGHMVDKVNKQWFHAARMLTGAAVLGGGALAFAPLFGAGVAAGAFGLSLLSAGAVTGIGLHFAGEFMGGFNMFNYPIMAWSPFREILQMFSPRSTLT